MGEAIGPAPIQITYLGYPNITGLDAIDYRIVDSHTDPTELEIREGGHTSEAFIRLDPCFLCFRPPVDAPPIAPRPDSPITFGSCNAIQKINEGVLGLWSRVLSAVPDSRLLLKAFNLREEGLREEVTKRLVAMGVPKDRLEVLGPIKEQRGHLDIYNRIDIALDSFPYNGTTTTCEALYMGVPVIAIAGETHASRVGVSLLNMVGHPEWVAQSKDDYVRIAASLANDPARRAQIRGTLRAQMLASPLCDGPGFCRRMEKALRAMWVSWCGQPAAVPRSQP